MFKKKLKILIILFLGLPILYVIYLIFFGGVALNERINKSYESLQLPTSFILVHQMEREEEGDLITSARAAQARTYKVSMEMTQAKDILLNIIQREEDQNAGKDIGDHRLSMHPEQLGIDSLKKFCTPGQLALKAEETYMTVIFSDTEEGARVELNGDAKVTNLGEGHRLEYDSEGRPLGIGKFERESCSSDPKESYVTLVIWAM